MGCAATCLTTGNRGSRCDVIHAEPEIKTGNIERCIDRLMQLDRKAERPATGKERKGRGEDDADSRESRPVCREQCAQKDNTVYYTPLLSLVRLNKNDISVEGCAPEGTEARSTVLTTKTQVGSDRDCVRFGGSSSRKLTPAGPP
jgi:hypothetical protein